MWTVLQKCVRFCVWIAANALNILYCCVCDDFMIIAVLTSGIKQFINNAYMVEFVDIIM